MNNYSKLPALPVFPAVDTMVTKRDGQVAFVVSLAYDDLLFMRCFESEVAAEDLALSESALKMLYLGPEFESEECSLTFVAAP